MAPNIFIFEIRLLHTEPVVWRIVEVKNNMTLHDLHKVIQVAMGWTNSHCYHFRQVTGNKSVDYTLPETENADESFVGNNPKDFKLKDVFVRFGEELEYLYDFGDDWRHSVIFKGRRYAHSTFGFPACVAGAMACPPEDIGGIPGYASLMNAITNKHKQQLAEYKEWLGYTYDPYDFSPTRLIFLGKMIRGVK